jgi:Ala-tRNA(Pro) deacylase
LPSESEVATTFADREPGAMPPFGNLYGLPCVDLALGRNERIVFQAATHSVTMSVACAAVEGLPGPTVADIAVARHAVSVCSEAEDRAGQGS